MTDRWIDREMDARQIDRQAIKLALDQVKALPTGSLHGVLVGHATRGFLQEALWAMLVCSYTGACWVHCGKQALGAGEDRWREPLSRLHS